MKLAVMSEQDLEEVKKRAKRDYVIGHLYLAYLTMFENACDPNSKVLELKPEILRAIDAYEKPRPAIIFCPSCHMQHIDRPEPDICECRHLLHQDHEYSYCRVPGCMCEEFKVAWTNPTHKSHTCRKDDGGCGLVFRLTDYPTTGVKYIETRGKDDTWAIHIRSTGE